VWLWLLRNLEKPTPRCGLSRNYTQLPNICCHLFQRGVTNNIACARSMETATYTCEGGNTHTAHVVQLIQLPLKDCVRVNSVKLLYSVNCFWVFISKVFISARPQSKVAQYTYLRNVSGPTSTGRKLQHFKTMTIKLIMGSSTTISVHVQSDSSRFTRRPARVSARISSVTC
jgi:hypothetical protein